MRAHRVLVVVLRFTGVVLLTALFPAAMPYSWMDAVHARLGLGTLPDDPIVGYLTRSCSLLYAFHGALLLYLSTDLRRYLPAIRFLVAISVPFGAALFWIDRAVGMPAYWVAFEGPPLVLFALVLWWLAGKARRDLEPDAGRSPRSTR